MKKPPVGLFPKFIVDENRIVEICEAIIRYASEGKKIPKLWRKELNYLLKAK